MKKILLFAVLIVMGSSAFAQHVELALVTSIPNTFNVEFQSPTGYATNGGCDHVIGTFKPSSIITILGGAGGWNGYADNSSDFSWSESLTSSFFFSSIEVQVYDASTSSGWVTVYNTTSPCYGTTPTAITCDGSTFYIHWDNITGSNIAVSTE